MPRFIAIVPENPSRRAQSRIQRLRALDNQFCALMSAEEAAGTFSEAVIFVDNSESNLAGNHPNLFWLDDGDPRESVGPKSIHEAIAAGAPRVFATLRGEWKGRQIRVWAARDVCRRPWDTIESLQNRLDDQIPLLLRDAADRLDGKGIAEVFSYTSTSVPAATINFRQRWRDRRYFLHLITSALQPLLGERSTKILLWHDPPVDVLDDALTALSRIGPFHSYGKTVELLRKGKSLSPGFVITFDDGRKGNLDLLDVLEKHGCSAMFFMVTGLVDTNRATWTYNPDSDKQLDAQHRWLKTLPFPEQRKIIEEAESGSGAKLRGRFSLTGSEIKLIAERGHEIGIHTENHPFMAQLTPTEMRHEVQESHEKLKDFLADPLLPLHLAYPYGNYNQTVVETMLSIGVQSAVTTRANPAQAAPNPLEIPRYMLSDKDYPQLAVLKTRSWFERLRSRRLR